RRAGASAGAHAAGLRAVRGRRRGGRTLGGGIAAAELSVAGSWRGWRRGRNKRRGHGPCPPRGCTLGAGPDHHPARLSRENLPDLVLAHADDRAAGVELLEVARARSAP